MNINVSKKKINDNNISIIDIENNGGLKACFLSFGAAFYSCSIKEKNFLVAPNNIEDYLDTTFYFGKAIGRVAGRINKGILEFEGNRINLEKNWNNESFLHGGSKGISNQNFSFNYLSSDEYTDLIFKHTLLESDDMIPGNIDLTVIYRIYENENRIKVIFEYTSDKNSIASFTNHACFNLNGKGDVLNHTLMISSNECGNLDNNLITKEVVCCDSVMDFSNPKKIGKDIESKMLQNHTAKGYDHPYILNKDKKVILYNDNNSITLTLTTTYPALVIYSDNYPTNYTMLSGEKDKKYAGICLEPSFYPNSINDMKIEKNKKNTEEIEYFFETK